MTTDSHYEKTNLNLSAKGSKLGRPLVWPFSGMTLGESVIVKDPKLHSTASSCYAYVAKRYGYKFTRKTLADGSLLVVRVE